MLNEALKTELCSNRTAIQSQRDARMLCGGMGGHGM